MLKYNIRLTDDNFRQGELVWSEKYLDPNLSFVSGVTDASSHLEKYDRINVSNSIINSSSLVSVESENVTREGYVIVSGKTYDVFSDSFVDYSVNESGDTKDYKYVFINGKYYYADNDDVFHIDNWLIEQSEGNVKEGYASGKTDDGKHLSLDTIYWIEDGTVTIDENTYFYDRDRNGLYLEDIESGKTLESSEITDCEDIEYRPYSSATEYNEVTKFRLIKDAETNISFEKVTYCNYFYYVLYKKHYCPIYKKVSGDTFNYVCEIPKYIYDPVNSSVEDGVSGFDLYFVSESSDGVLTNENYLKEISSEYISEHQVYDITDLRKTTAYIIVDGFVYYVENNIQNSNSGKEIAVYLEDESEILSIGDIIRFRNDSVNSFNLIVHKEDNTDKYILLFSNSKYYVEKNLCDKALINNNEYDIEYISGKTNGVDCLVTIGSEKVPFKVIEKDGEFYIERYGKIISGDSNSAVTANYQITPYDGVLINGRKFIVHDAEGYKYAELDDSNREYLFEVDDIIGSSMLVCKPYLTDTEYTKEFIEEMSSEMCDYVVNNQTEMFLFSKNKVFGSKEITKELAFINFSQPKSSDDYYNLFDNLVVYVRNGYINVPFQMGTTIGGNPIQGDIIERDFFEKEKKKAINPIVDMEKDVYYPKYINGDGKYEGASTNFLPIRQINLNLHFRTRNLDNWKVNEGFNDVSTSGKTDNWFVTDWDFYKRLIKTNGDELQETSDLLGLLYFTNYDVYYQKSKLAKSFVRLSYYDSTDPQTQQLLATSTVFIDEHALFKKYTDNSKVINNAYTRVSETEYTATNKITVFTEFGDDINEDRRLSSRITIKNKYETNTSAEGFYIHMFREYSENLRPKPIYMKVEFNHAGVGKTIPFSIPMKWSGSSEVSGETNPISALTLARESNEIKKGYPLSYVYAQSYIPLYAVYDFKNKEYAYVFDDRYFIGKSKEKIYKNGTVNLNLFEMKIRNENTANDDERKAISNRQQVKAVINVNTGQFDIVELKCR